MTEGMTGFLESGLGEEEGSAMAAETVSDLTDPSRPKQSKYFVHAEIYTFHFKISNKKACINLWRLIFWCE